MLLVVIRARAFREEIVLVFVPVKTMIRQCTEQLERGVQIQLLLAALMQLCQLDQAAGRNCRRGGILPRHILGLAEIDRNQPALRNIRDKVVRDPLRRLQICAVSGVQETQRILAHFRRSGKTTNSFFRPRPPFRPPVWKPSPPRIWKKAADQQITQIFLVLF